ncbi:MAG: bifunctional riboflavin kinase/FAD synthetase [Acidobacteria bacterium]|nr:bifunctional riboflavin kinase/FAD synthetase [Acidobacteriota bacterium]
MKSLLLHYPDDAPPPWLVHPVLALGNFDGLHRGHLKILERVKRGAAERGGSPMAMTFDPHPPRVVRPDKAPPLLMTTAQRLEALDRAGIPAVAVVRFTPELSRWEPERFVRVVLAEWLRVSEVWVGADFLFGRDRTGNFSALRTLGQLHGFRAEKIDPVRYKEFVVSSTRIRRLVSEGRMDEAGALLGHHYFIDGVVVEGRGRGRGLGVPTANLQTENELLPPNGVYATAVAYEGTVYPSVTNVGVRPTFDDGTEVTVETHLLGSDLDLYGRRLRLHFVQRMRDERRFPDVDALRAQIDADRRRAERLFRQLSI